MLRIEKFLLGLKNNETKKRIRSIYLHTKILIKSETDQSFNIRPPSEHYNIVGMYVINFILTYSKWELRQ